MVISIDEFSKDLFQEILSEADADERFAEDVFFDRYCSFLTDAGEIDTADRADHRSLGVRVDGYGGDPVSSSGTLSLIIADFNQSPEVGRLVATEMNAIFQRVSKFLNKSLDMKWRNSLEETSPGFGLADLIAKRWSKINRVRMFLLSNRELSERVDGREADKLDGRTVTFSVWDIKRLHRFATIGHGREDIEIDLEKEFGSSVPLLPAHLSADEYEAYLAVVPGEMLARIYDRWGARLLEQNVRVFLQARGNVNKGIRNTLENDPSMFFAYNNGITATAEAISSKVEGGQIYLTGLKNFQVVNGGQTTASIHVAFRNKVDLSKVFVQMKLSIVAPNRTDNVVPKISEYANSQNRVNAADFFANHPFHVRMEEFSRRVYAPSPDGTFRETKWFYERARGQFADARSLLTPAQRKKFDLENPRSQLVSKTDLAKFLNVWTPQPDKVCLGAQKNFAHFAHSTGISWKKNQDNFNEVFFQEAVAKAIIFKATEKLVSAQPWYPGTIRSQIVAYTISKMAFDVTKLKKSVDFGRIWSSQSLGQDMEMALVSAAKQVNQEWEDPTSRVGSVGEWAKKASCWEKIKGIAIIWPEGFIADLITSEEKREEKAGARKNQKVLNGIEAQTTVFEAGSPFWRTLLDWGTHRRILSELEVGVLRTATQMPSRLPSEKQSLILMEVYKRAQLEGFGGIAE